MEKFKKQWANFKEKFAIQLKIYAKASSYAIHR